MVGFHKNDTISTSEKLVAGCFAGVITRFITQPLDIIKLRTQVSKKQKGMLKTVFRIFKEEGLKAFYQGHILGQIHSILSVSCQFYVYEITTKYVAEIEVPHQYKFVIGHFKSFRKLWFISVLKFIWPISRIVCGAFAGAASATLVIPLEVIRIRQMLVKEQYGGLIKGARAVYKYGGFLAFYEGLSASVLQMGPQVAISFYVFSSLQPFILRFLEPCSKSKTNTNKQTNHCPRPESLALASSIAGSAAGFASKTFTYPLDLAKRRLQIGSHKRSDKYPAPSTAKKLIKCVSLRDCIQKTVEKEGIKGLFRGWSVTVYKAQITSILAFTSYELACLAIKEFHQNT